MSTYDYGHNAGGGNAPQGPRQENDLTFWILVLISFVLFWPLGLFLVILSVFLLYGSDRIHIRAGVASAFVCAALGGRVVDKIDTARMKICVYGFIGVAGLITIAANWQSLAALVG